MSMSRPLNDEENKRTILDFISRHSLCVLSTVNKKGNPASAVVEFAETNGLALIIDTLSDKRKYKNLKNNSSVSCVIGWDDNKTVQFEGIAVELEGEELSEYKDVYFKKLPESRAFEKWGDLRFFKITPTWIRYSDFSVDPWIIHEIDSTT